MSCRLVSTPNQVCDALGAWYVDEKSRVARTHESKAILKDIEDVFFKYFDCHRPTIPDKRNVPIANQYLRDWCTFLSEIRDFVRKIADLYPVNRRESYKFNMICPVMHLSMRIVDIKTRAVGDFWCIHSVTLLIDSLRIRPCAMGWNFLELVILEICAVIRKFDETMMVMDGLAVRFQINLKIQVAGVCAAFVHSTLNGKGLQPPYVHHEPDAARIDEWDFDRKNLRLLDIALSQVSIDLPKAAELNNYNAMSDAARAKRNTIIREMFLAQDTRASKEVGLAMNNLIVCKNGVCTRYYAR